MLNDIHCPRTSCSSSRCYTQSSLSSYKISRVGCWTLPRERKVTSGNIAVLVGGVRERLKKMESLSARTFPQCAGCCTELLVCAFYRLSWCDDVIMRTPTVFTRLRDTSQASCIMFVLSFWINRVKIHSLSVGRLFGLSNFSLQRKYWCWKWINFH